MADLEDGVTPSTRTPTDTPPVPLHSKLGPRKASQWVNCTRSLSFIDENEHRLPPETTSVYAEEGTVAHDVAASELRIVTKGTRAWQVLPEWAELSHYFDECPALAAAGGDVYIEERVPLWYHPTDEGTVDYAVVSDTAIHVRDLKWGQGEFVDHEQNEQLAVYAMSLVCHLESLGLYGWGDDTPVTIGIVQPRYRGEEKVRVWSLTLGELRTFTLRIEAAAMLVLENDPETLVFAPGAKTCRWCRASAICPAYNAATSDSLPVPLEDAAALLPNLDVTSVPDERVLLLLQSTEMIENSIKAAWAYAAERAAAGNPIAGTKMVLGREGDREWADEEAADKLLTAAKIPAEKRYPCKLISVAQAEKLLKPMSKAKPKLWKRFGTLITRSAAKPTLVLASDPRPALADLTAELPTLTDETNE